MGLSQLYRKDIISALDFTREIMDSLFQEADNIRRELKDRKFLDYCRDKVMVTVFLEPSTRTRLSFHFAMIRLGGHVVDFGLEQAASIAKGESFEDTIKMVDGYNPDIIVLRHREPGSAAKAAEISSAPIINAGDGWNEHPTQALLDLYTIKRELGKIDGVVIGIMGDLKYGRTPSSLSYALSKYRDVKIFYIAPKELQVRREVIEKIEGLVEWSMVERVEEVIEELDILYVTRLQRERFSNPAEYERLRGSYIITSSLLMKFKKIPLIMHPLPRVDELSKDVDVLPTARYFTQAENGVYIRAALVKNILGV
ncbi:MAG: aspartate carbamoyltransferase [Nitrososphaerota archaeon]|nr:aspartate carbamoyltransferase [Nitrososphaerota archaeon]